MTIFLYCSFTGALEPTAKSTAEMSVLFTVAAPPPVFTVVDVVVGRVVEVVEEEAPRAPETSACFSSLLFSSFHLLLPSTSAVL